MTSDTSVTVSAGVSLSHKSSSSSSSSTVWKIGVFVLLLVVMMIGTDIPQQIYESAFAVDSESAIDCDNNSGLSENDSGDRFFFLMNLWRYQSAGMFNQAYYSRVLFPAQWEHDYDTLRMTAEELAYSLTAWVKVKSYICAGDALSDAERTQMIADILLWSWDAPLTSEMVTEAIDSSVNMDEQALNELLMDPVLTDPKRILLETLPTIAIDDANGMISDAEKDRFLMVCRKFNVDEDDCQFILETFAAEVELRKVYDELLRPSDSEPEPQPQS